MNSTKRESSKDSEVTIIWHKEKLFKWVMEFLLGAALLLMFLDRFEIEPSVAWTLTAIYGGLMGWYAKDWFHVWEVEEKKQ